MSQIDTAEKRVRGRVWMGTIWEEEDLDLVKNIAAKGGAQYGLISDEDHTKEGQLHRHVLLQFKNAVVRPKTKSGHWERPKAVIGAREYCLSKGENYLEYGAFSVCTR